MDISYFIQTSQKNKHLSFEHYEYIVHVVMKHELAHKGKKRNTGRTALIKKLALEVGTTVSNIYTILHAAKVTVLDTNLIEHTDYSSIAAFNRRTRHLRVSNNSKLEKAKPFIDMVIKEVKTNKLSSIDETINYLKLHEPDKLEGLETVCTKTMYNYVHQHKIDLKKIDLPRMVRFRKSAAKYKSYIPKRQKGTSIDHRPFDMDDRSEFGHWEGDLVTGPRDGVNGAFFTLIERKTRFYLMIPIKNKKAKSVYMQFNRLHKFYGDAFKNIFKSITFDNGSEFARYADIEKKPGTSSQRTKVYFAHPYRSCERGSNENCNGLIRRFIKKGTDINTIPKSKVIDINNKINRKKRKINNYLPSEQLFLDELAKLNVTEHTIFYLS